MLVLSRLQAPDGGMYSQRQVTVGPSVSMIVARLLVRCIPVPPKDSAGENLPRDLAQ